MTITIKHTHEDGTLVYGTSKGDGVYELIGPRTAARFRYFPSIRMLGIAQSRDHLAKRWQIDMAAKALREAGYEVEVEIDDTPRDVADVKSDRADRLDARHDRLTAKAERNKAEGDARHAAADAISERFAGGQPILVGHHSERRARRDHERMDGHDRAANAHYAKAEWAQQAASVVGREESRRERPDVVIRRIDKTEAELRQTQHHIDGTRPANDWRSAYYAPESKPASGAWLEQLTARKTYLEHQLAADRALLAEHEANGYIRLTRETVHKGDIVYWSVIRQDRATVTRVNPKTVSLNRSSYPRTLPYEEIQKVECPHEDKATAITFPKRETVKRETPAVVIERPAEREAPITVDARTEFFPTPPAVVEQMIAAADLESGMTVLEPSAGLGAIATPVARLVSVVACIERNQKIADRLRDTGTTDGVTCADFLEIQPMPMLTYDRVMMNPPFSGQADIAHVRHALGFVKPGGRLVAVMSAGVEFRQDKTTTAFRQLVEEYGGRIERLPDDAFETSGTNVRTVMAVIPVPVPVSEPAGPSRQLSLFGEEPAA